MKALVTGAAGFIGSSIVDRLISDGHAVVGVDNFNSFYSKKIKLRNLSCAFGSSAFSLVEADLAVCDITQLLKDVTHVFHQAGQPGVQSSWGEDFHNYVRDNIWATSRLLEACRRSPTLSAFVAASSSSIYGRIEKQPTSESVIPTPISPYGVTKLAAENLCTLYASEYGLPVTSLRYFTVYGPRQRPDMAISKIIASALHDRAFTIFGDGTQRRSFTFVDDVVEANLLVAELLTSRKTNVSVFNVGNSDQMTLKELIGLVEQQTQKSIFIEWRDAQPGDPLETMADSSLLEHETGWRPHTDMETGIRLQILSVAQD